VNALTVITNTAENVEAYRASTNAASICKDIVVKTATSIQGRKYVGVEGWMAIAVAHGCTASARDVERVDGGVRAIGEIRRMSDGHVIAEAEGFVGEDEPTWYGGETEAWDKQTRQKARKVLPKRPDYAIRAMAQTRAISRACRSAFAHVVVMMDAGLATTPAEEVPLEGFDRDTGEIIEQRPAAPKLITDDQRDIIQTLAPAAGKTTQEICQAYRITALTELTEAQAVKLIERLKADKKPNPQADEVLADEIPY
jgi:hypothetical protein